MRNGANIQEINCIRRHLSEIKGGKLAKACKGKMIALVLSDVVGDRLDCIASGTAIGDSGNSVGPGEHNVHRAIIPAIGVCRRGN